MAKVTQSQRIVKYVSSRKTPATAVQIATNTGIGINTVRARVAELTRAGTFQARSVNGKGATKGYIAN